MKDASKELLKTHPVIIFWIGLLTGALIVGLVFLYKFMNPTQLESSLFRSPVLPSTSRIQSAPPISPTTINSTVSPLKLNAFPTPPGGLQAFPTPPGG